MDRWQNLNTNGTLHSITRHSTAAVQADKHTMLQIVILFHSCPLYIDRLVSTYTQSVVVLEDCNALNGKHSEPHIYLNIYINSIFVVNMFCGIQQLLRNATYNHAF